MASPSSFIYLDSHDDEDDDDGDNHDHDYHDDDDYCGTNLSQWHRHLLSYMLTVTMTKGEEMMTTMMATS